MIKGLWWKLTGLALVLYSVIAGQLITVPALPVIHETIRNLFYHVWYFACLQHKVFIRI